MRAPALSFVPSWASPVAIAALERGESVAWKRGKMSAMGERIMVERILTDAKMGTLGTSGIGRSWRAISAVQLWKLRSWIWQPRKKIVNPQLSYERRQSELRTTARGRTLRKPRVRWCKDEIHMENDALVVIPWIFLSRSHCPISRSNAYLNDECWTRLALVQ